MSEGWTKEHEQHNLVDELVDQERAIRGLEPVRPAPIVGRRETNFRYDHSALGRARDWRDNNSEKGRERKRRYNRKRRGNGRSTAQ